MGMATARIKDVRKSKYNDCVVCLHCDAEYDVNTEFFIGYCITPRDCTETTKYQHLADIPKGICPMCRKAP